MATMEPTFPIFVGVEVHEQNGQMQIHSFETLEACSFTFDHWATMIERVRHEIAEVRPVGWTKTFQVSTNNTTFQVKVFVT
jgi:hypothetical protein